MNLLEQTKELCKIYEIHPQRSKGQNFLIQENVFEEIVAAAEITAEECVLEVGPGLGFMTSKLAQAAKRVVAVELDDRLAEILQLGLDAHQINNVTVVNKNILDLANAEGFKELGLEKYKIVANLPYNITSIFLRKFLENAAIRPQSMILMLQKEVAERIVAASGKMSMLSLSIHFFATAEIIHNVPRQYFWPQPDVDSAVIKIVARPEARIKADKNNSHFSEKEFFKLAKFGFGSKRKMLKNNLAGGYHLSNDEAEKLLIAAGLNPKTRAEELTIDEWLNLLATICKNVL